MAAAMVLPLSGAFAQQAAAPVQLSDEQVSQIVKAVTGAVLEELNASQQPASSKAAQTPQASPNAQAAPATPITHAILKPQSAEAKPGDSKPGEAGTGEGLTSFLLEEQYLFLAQLERAILAFPALSREIGSIFSRLGKGPDGRGFLAFLSLVAAISALAVALAFAAKVLARRFLPGSEPKAGAASIGQTLRRAGASLAGFVAFWFVMAIAASKLFSGHDMQALVGHWLLMGGVHFALLYTVFRIFFRPSETAYRIVPLDSRDARMAMRLFVTMIAVMVVRSWIAIPMTDNLPKPVIAAGLLVNNALFVASFFLAAYPARGAVGRWIESATMSPRVSPMRRWLAANWLTLAGMAVLAISAIHAFGAVLGRVGATTGLTGTVRIVLLMILVCAFVEFLGRRGERADQAARRAIPKLPGLVSQMMRVLILTGAAIYFIRLWCVDALGVMTQAQWSNLASYAFEPLAAIFGGYLAVSYVNYLSARYLALNPVAVAKVADDGEVITKSDGSSRLRTLIPIMRVTAITIIVVMMTLLVMSHLGFNITPLLAGASVIGLAISFGSQALVKDIVSGVLFLAEDSFRVGEYIECGKSIGTVEGFTLRSVRLRHQDGQIYTVPFGQLGEITNFSRDWSTRKFNLSLDRDVDLDDVREVARKVGLELKAEFKDRLLDPLMVQGVKDVTDTAIVVQFKFTTLPLDPGEIERVARSRLLKLFKEQGIALARHPWYGSMTPASA